jgi:hypothetical protein
VSEWGQFKRAVAASAAHSTKMHRRVAAVAQEEAEEAPGGGHLGRRFSKQWLMSQMDGVDLSQLAALRLHDSGTHSGATSGASSGTTTPTRHAAQANDANNRFFKLLARFIRLKFRLWKSFLCFFSELNFLELESSLSYFDKGK